MFTILFIGVILLSLHLSSNVLAVEDDGSAISNASRSYYRSANGTTDITELASTLGIHKYGSTVDLKSADYNLTEFGPLSSLSEQELDALGIETKLIVDYFPEPPSPIEYSPFSLPFGTMAADSCGDGGNEFMTLAGGIRWRTFPITYAIDPQGSGQNAESTKSSVISSFSEFDKVIAGTVFTQTNDVNTAGISVIWAPIDGPGGILGQTQFFYFPSTLAIVEADITMDAGDSWFISPVHNCGGVGNDFDIQDIMTHELGHGMGLGHVQDDALLTMYPFASPGETIKRSLGNGDKEGINFLYPIAWTSSWTSLGGGVSSNTDPTVIANDDGRLQAFVVGTNNQLYEKSQTVPGSSPWTGWTSLGGGIKADTSPAVARNSDGRLQVFVVGTNNQLYYKTQMSAGSSTWSTSWTSLGGGLRASTDPTVIANDDGRLQAFVVGTNNALYYKTQTAAGSSTWSSSWTSLGGGLRASTDPAVIANDDGRLQAFVVGTNNALYYKTQTAAGSSTWSSSWTSLGGGIKADTSPDVARNSDGRLQVFVVGTNNALYYKTQTAAGSSTWSTSWTSLGGGLRASTDPTVIANDDGRLQAFVVGTNNAIYYKWQTSPST
jgi:hypothetical protein